MSEKTYTPNKLYALLIALNKNLEYLFKEYRVTDERVEIESGMMSTEVDSVELNRVENIEYSQDPIQGILGVGNVTLSDASNKNVSLEGVKNPKKVKEFISSKKQYQESSEETQNASESSGLSTKTKRRMAKSLNKMNNNIDSIEKNL